MVLRRFPFLAIKTLNQQIKVKVQRLLIDIKSITSVIYSGSEFIGNYMSTVLGTKTGHLQRKWIDAYHIHPYIPAHLSMSGPSGNSTHKTALS